MAEYVKRLELDFNAEYRNGYTKTVFAKQLDENSRFLLIEPQMDGEKFDVRECTVKLYAERPDRQVITADGEITDEGNIYVEISSDMISVVGTVICDLKLLENGKQLSSCLFFLNVIKSVGMNVPEPADASDHENIIVDLYRLNDTDISPVQSNSAYVQSAADISPITVNTAVSQTAAVTQTEVFTVTPIECNFQEDVEL